MVENFILKWHWAINPILTLFVGLAFLYLGYDNVGYIPKSWNFPIAKGHYFSYFIIILQVVELVYYSSCEEKFVNIREERDKYKKLFFATISTAEASLKTLLIDTSRILKFKSRIQMEDRITLYVYTEGGFFALSRFSECPSFEEIKKKKVYCSTKGCIGRGWNDRFHFDDAFPDPKGKSKDDYEKRHRQEYGLSHAEVRDIGMKSRLYAALRIEKDDRKLGVVVLESLSADRFSQNECKDILVDLSKKVAPLLSLIDTYSREIDVSC